MKKIVFLLLLGLVTTKCSVQAGQLTSDTYILDHYQITKFLKDNGYDVMKSWEQGRSIDGFKSALKSKKSNRKIDLSKVGKIVDFIWKLGFSSYDKKDEIYQFLKENELLFLSGAQKCGYFDKDTRNLSAWAKKIKEGYKKLYKDNPELFKVFEQLIKQSISLGVKEVTAVIPISKDSEVDVDDLCDKLLEVIAPQTKGLYGFVNKDDKRFVTPTFHVIFELSKGQITLTGLPQIPQAFFTGIESFANKSMVGKIATAVGVGALLLGGYGVNQQAQVLQKGYSQVPATWRNSLENNVIEPVLGLFSIDSTNQEILNELKVQKKTIEDLVNQNNVLLKKSKLNSNGSGLLDICSEDKKKDNALLCEFIDKALKPALDKKDIDTKQKLDVKDKEIKTAQKIIEELDTKIKNNLKETTAILNNLDVDHDKDDTLTKLVEKVNGKIKELGQRLNESRIASVSCENKIKANENLYKKVRTLQDGLKKIQDLFVKTQL